MTSSTLRTVLPRLTRISRQSSILSRSLLRLPSTVTVPSTSTSSRFFSQTTSTSGSGSNDSHLSSLLSKELSYEKESLEQTPSEPEFLTNFKSKQVWKILDSKSSDEVKLERQFGNESIRVLFSISDVDSDNPTAGMQDENEDGEEGETENESQVEEMEGEDATDFNFRVAITISKPKGGALTIDSQVEEGSFVIDNISYYKDSKLADDLSADADWARRGMYIGPQFETLDSEVQSQFTEYLEERGIDTDLALFIPSYAEWKEQKEYVSWLENVKDFVDA